MSTRFILIRMHCRSSPTTTQTFRCCIEQPTRHWPHFQSHRYLSYNSGSGGPLYPYSGSLPSPGYEWCKRCNIPCRSLQKAIGEHNECLDLPPKVTFWFLGLHTCPSARKYYKEQLTTMVFLTAFCFVALPAGTTLGLSGNEFDDE